MTDFFVSYNKADKPWAEWIAWQLEEAGYSTVLQAWDFKAGDNFVLAMQKATSQSERTIAVLSPDYLTSSFTASEWAVAFAKDPTGEKGVLVPVRVRKCEPEGLLPQIIYIDLLDQDEEPAKTSLLEGLQPGRAKPQSSPVFPGKITHAVVHTITKPQTFPGTVVVTGDETSNVPEGLQSKLEDKKPLIAKSFLLHLTRGGIKSLPLMGALVDEMIVGMLDGEERATESAKLANTLAAIQKRQDTQQDKMDQLISKSVTEGGFTPLVSQGILQFVATLRNPSLAPSKIVEASVTGLLNRHNILPEVAERDPTAVFLQLEQASQNIGSSRGMDRAKFVNWLYGLRNDDLDSLILNLPGASNRITENAGVRRRVNELIGWADSSTGVGLEQVYQTAQMTNLFPL